MGLFEEAGKRFEQFKQEATAAAEEQAEFECTDCGERLFAAADACPECGAAAVVPIESAEEETSVTSSDDRPGVEQRDGSETDG